MLAIACGNFGVGLLAGRRCSSLTLIVIAVTEMLAILVGNGIDLLALPFFAAMLTGSLCLQAGYCVTVFGPILLSRTPGESLRMSRRYR